MIALPTGKSTRLLGMWDQSEMELDTQLCSLVVSESTSSTRDDWLWSWERNGKKANKFFPPAD